MPTTAVFTVPVTVTESVPSITSVAVAPGSVNVLFTVNSMLEAPLRVMTGASVSTIKVALLADAATLPSGSCAPETVAAAETSTLEAAVYAAL